MLAKGVSSEVHDSIGRVVLNMTNFRPGTTYVLNYNIYAGELLEQRKKASGTVTLRLRIEHNDSPRQAILTGLSPPEQSLVSVSRKIDYDVANYVADGAVDDTKFSLDTITRYLDELYTYDIVVDYINKAIMTVCSSHSTDLLFACRVSTMFLIYLFMYFFILNAYRSFCGADTMRSPCAESVFTCRSIP